MGLPCLWLCCLDVVGFRLGWLFHVDNTMDRIAMDGNHHHVVVTNGPQGGMAKECGVSLS